MEFNEKEFLYFIRKFGGDFMNLLPDEIAVYMLQDVFYQLPSKEKTLSMINESMENGVNLLLQNPIYTFSEEDFI